MPDFSHAGIENFTPEQQRYLRRLGSAVNNIGTQTNSAPVGQIAPPLPHSGISVLGGGGYLDIALADSNSNYIAKNHFVDVADNPSFNNARKVDMGSALSHRVNVGPGTFHVRSYAAYATSGPSDFLNHEPVSTNGALPPMQAGNDAGTAFGPPFTGAQPPKRA